MAALKFTFNTQQFTKEIEKDFDQLVLKIDTVMFAEIKQAEADAITRVPVDKGFLKNSIEAYRANVLSYELVAAEFYAPFVEFGTGNGVRIPPGYEQLARESGDAGIAQGRRLFGYKGGTFKPNNRAQPFLIPAFEAFVTRFIKAVEKLTI